MFQRITRLIGRFNVAKKMALSSIIVIVFAAISGIYSFITLRASRVIDDKLTDHYYPLISSMKDYEDIITSTSSLSTNWMYLPNPEDKARLVKMESEEFPKLKQEILTHASIFEEDEAKNVQNLLDRYEEVIPKIKQLRESLNNDEAYQDDFLLFDLIPLLDEDISAPLGTLEEDVNKLTADFRSKADLVIQEKFNSFDSVEIIITIMTLLAVGAGVLSTIFVIRSIVGPVKEVNRLINRMSLGELPEFDVKETNDEIGDMISSMRILREGLSSTARFAEEIKQGDLGTHHKLLSDNDILGQSLVTMRDNLKRVIDETNSIVLSVAEEGNLSQKLSMEDKQGAWKDVSESINSLFDSISRPIQPMSSVLESVASGDLTVRMDDESLNGDFRRLSNSLNYALNNLNSFLSDIRQNAHIIDEYTNEMLSSGEEMSTSTGEIATAISEMSNGAQSQVHKVDESSQLVENILTSSTEMASRSEAINAAARKGVQD